MNINEIYSRLCNKENFEITEQSVTKFNCPKCKKELLTISLLKDGKPQYKSPQKYLYDDGDIINLPQKYWLKVDREMAFGTCHDCNNEIGLIDVNVLDKKIDKKSIKYDCFTIRDQGELINSFKEVKQYSLSLNNKVIGSVIVYKKAIINKDAVEGLLENIERNIALVSLECLDEKEDMKVSGMGICNCSCKNEKQFDVWQKGSLIAEKLINSVEKLLN